MENSREKILSVVKNNQGEVKPLPVTPAFPQSFDRLVKFGEVLKSIGGKVSTVRSIAEIEKYIQENFGAPARVISAIPGFSGAEMNQKYNDLPSLHDVDLFITQASLGVAENGAVWLTEDALHERALPFISQHLAVVLDQKNIVSTMHEAYEKIGSTDYGFATFIAGPSKTADIEQSLVLGAHGAMTMTVFVLID
jgi:L-lactate dehydrogenase complex protein LldG